MEQTELHELCKTLTVRELNSFTQFLDTPYLSKGPYRSEIKILWSIFLKHFQEGNLADVSREELVKMVFTGDSKSYGQINRVFFELAQCVRQFIAWEYYMQDANTRRRKLDVAKFLYQRGDIPKSRQVQGGLHKELFNLEAANTDLYDLAFEVSLLGYNLAAINNKWKDDLQISTALNYLELYYCSSKLDLLNHYLILKSVTKLENLSEVQQSTLEIRQHLLDSSIYLNISYKIFKLLTTEHPSTANFEFLIDLIIENEDKLDEESLKRFYSYVRHYCARLILGGQSHLFPLLHKIHKENLEKGYFYYLGSIPAGAFMNIAITALRSGAEAWTIVFIEKHKDKLIGPADENQEVDRLARALYHFHTGNYDKALDLLPDTSVNLNRLLIIRCLEIKIYYELRSEILSFKLDAFRVYLTRASQKVMSEDNKEQYASFVNLTAQIINLPPNPPAAKVEKIIERIESKTAIVEKEWLMQKILALGRPVGVGKR